MRRKAIWIGCIVFIFAICDIPLNAAPINGEIIELEQPDGTIVQVRFYGDEYYTRGESLDGYTLIRDPLTGWIVYADVNEESTEFESTDVIYDHRIPTDPDHPSHIARMQEKGIQANEAYRQQGRALRKQMRLTRQARLEKHRRRRLEVAEQELAAANGLAMEEMIFQAAAAENSPAPLTGNLMGLTILVEFQDIRGTIPVIDVYNYCNQEGFSQYNNNGSIRDYFYGISGGLLEYENVVTDYILLDHDKAYYDNNCNGWGRTGELIDEAMDKLCAQGFDFSEVDKNNNRITALNIFYAGNRGCGWSLGLWPHKSYHGYTSPCGVKTGTYQITNMGSSIKIGTFCHENGHMICGWPDLYDYGGESRGCGNYDLMAGGNYTGGGGNPVPPNPYFRYLKGWETYIDITSSQPGTLYTATANPFNDPANPLISYIYRHPTNTKEYFLIENCQKIGRRSNIPDAGLLIWHVDEDGSNNNEQMTPSQHYKVSVEQADGAFHLENDNNQGGGGDLFHAPNADTFSDTTVPDALWWDGSESGLMINDISNLGNDMTFYASPPEIVAHYEFEGNTQDSALENDGTPYGNPVYVSGVIGTGAIDLNGANYVEIPRTISHTFTIAFWMKTTTPGPGSSHWWSGAGLVDGEVSGSTNDCGVSLFGNQVAFGVGNPDTTVIAPTNVVDGDWHHVAVTRNHIDGQIKIFIDGIERVADTGPTGSKGAAPRLTIGCIQTIQNYFQGQIDEVRLYRYILSDRQISELSDILPPSPNPATFDLIPVDQSSGSITIAATEGTDINGPVEYYFEETSGNPGGMDSGWQYTSTWKALDLRSATQYAYRVKMRDTVGNETLSSEITQVVTSPSADMDQNGQVHLPELILLAEHWMDVGCGSADLYCGGTDQDTSGQVNLDDFSSLSANWNRSDFLSFPVAYWPFNEGAGLITSDIAGGHTGDLYGMIQDGWTPAMKGMGLAFDGVDDYVEITNYKGILGALPRTFTLWLRTLNDGVLLSYGNFVAGEKWLLGILPSGVLQLVVGSGNIVGTTFLTDNQWHHVAVVVPDIPSVTIADVQCYVDGQPEAVTPSSSQVIQTAAGEDMHFGAFDNAGVMSSHWAGTLDDVRIYQQAASASFIQDFAFPNPHAYWPLDQSDGSLAPDAANNGYIGTLQGSPSWESGKVGNCLNFDGVDDYVEITNYKGILGALPRTFTLWLRTSNDGVLLSYGNFVAGEKWLLGILPSGVLQLVVGSGNIVGTTFLTDNQWHHVAVVVPDIPSVTIADVQCYVDGQPEAVTPSSSQAIQTAAGEDMHFGAFDNAGVMGSHLAGWMDELRMYESDLTVEQIQQIMNEL